MHILAFKLWIAYKDVKFNVMSFPQFFQKIVLQYFQNKWSIYSVKYRYFESNEMAVELI